MATLTVNFEFTNGDNTHSDWNEFDAEGDLEQAIADYADEVVETLNADETDEDVEWECEGWETHDHSIEFEDQQGPEDFDNLNDWANYCETADQIDWRHRFASGGDAYCARYNDVGEHNFDDEYVGDYGSFEEYAEQYVDDCMDLDETSRRYFDIESFARDLRYDYTCYEGGAGVFVFRDC